MGDVMVLDFSCDGACALVAMKDNFEPASKSPEKFENGNVEGDAGDGKPHAGFTTEDAVHAGEKFTTLRFSIMTPFGLPVEPEV